MDAHSARPRELWTDLYDYWLAQIENGKTESCDPVADLPHLAPTMVVMEFAAGGFRYAHFGSTIGSKLNFDATGAEIGESDLVEAVKMTWRNFLEMVVRTDRPRLAIATGDPGITHYIFGAPLRSSDRTRKRILVAVFFDERAGTKVIIRNWKERELTPPE